ncbi:ribonuclease E domain-containing protein [Paracoccus aminophilus]|uniref:Type IV pilus biogenesis n=1 Tax=Paracoccus aminophilus JCM 7686 TaxID=1367847 RepID=S5Y9B7_PARAH|nr:hypothetical protein [Paracoccus aminophilus]AGT07953.1 hypothetical protein JCM7686_0844 [Paracoccus aminophilus JCM 7686]
MQPHAHPDHALSFSADAVHLLRRAWGTSPDDWEEIGFADFSSPSFRSDLAELRGTISHAPDLVPVVLVIPDDQILYTDLSVPVGVARTQAVGLALDGLTPYAIEELAFDWDGEGNDIRVAAVARQTLIEAQEFASRHGFDGCEYSAQPAAEDFPGRPIFRLDDDVEDAPVSNGVHSDAFHNDAFHSDAFTEGLPELPSDAAASGGYDTQSAADLDLDLDLEGLDAHPASEQDITDVTYIEVAPEDTAAALDTTGAEEEGGAGSEAFAPEAQAEGEVASEPASVEPVEEAEIEEITAPLADLPEDSAADAADSESADPDLPETAEIAAEPAVAELIPTEIPASSAAAPSDELAEIAADDAAPIEAEVTVEAADGAEALDADTPAHDQEPLADSVVTLTSDEVEPVAHEHDTAAHSAGDTADKPLGENAAHETPTADELAALLSAEVAGPAHESAADLDQAETDGAAPENLSPEAEAGFEPEVEPEPEDELTEAERLALALAAAEVAAEEEAAARGLSQRGGNAALNPRARAVRDRAMEARRARGDEEEVLAAPERPRTRRAGERGGVFELALMLGALVIGIGLVWIFFMPHENPAEVALRNAARGTTPEIARTSSDPATALPETAPETATGAATPVSAAPATSPVVVPDSALSPAERAAVIEAATQPLLAILPDPEELADTELVEAEAMSQPVATAQPISEPAPQTAPVATAPATPAEALAEAARAQAAAAQPGQTATAPQAEPVVASPPAPTQAAPVQAAPAPTTPAQPAQVAVAPAPTAAAPAPTAPAQPAPRVEAAKPATQPRAEPAQPVRTARAGLTSSARPQSATAPRKRAAVPDEDTPPRVPGNPLPYEVAQKKTGLTGSARPPARPARARAAASTNAAATAPAAPRAPEAAASPAPASSQTSQLRSSSRPPSRPEGSAPDTLADAPLTPAEQSQLDGLRLDLRAKLPGVQISALSPVPEARGERYAEARPAQRPKRKGGVDAAAVDSAVREAAKPASSASRGSTVPASGRNSGVQSSDRPHARPGAAASTAAVATGGKKAKSKTDDAVKEAIASAVSESSASRGGVELKALRSSALPPRRSGAAAVAAAAAATSTKTEEAPVTMTLAAAAPTSAGVPTVPETAAAAPNDGGANTAEIAERRRVDEQLQAQAEARIRARAQADAAAEAQARAQAEARARAQEEAEAQAAARQRQTYRPAEVDNEPEVALNVPKGASSAVVASAATQKRGLDMGRTTIIGIIGAGQASRALIRLSSGKIVTVRLGDRIDGGTINSIGDGRITYVKAGQLRELRMLDGR